jgi:class 3 adenylate cyclase
MRDAGRIYFLKGCSSKQRLRRVIFLFLILIVLLIALIGLINALKWIDKPFAGFLLNQRMVVAVEGEQHWTGIKAGLKYPDKILKVNGEEISSTSALEGIIGGVRIGDPIRYIIERNGRRFEVVIPTMRFSIMDFLMIYGIYAFQGILYLLIGIIVFILKPDTGVSWIFLSVCLLQGIASFLQFDTASTHAGLVRVIFFCDAFLPAFGIHLSFLFPEKLYLVDRRPYLIMMPYIFSAFMFANLEVFYPRPVSLLVNKIVMVYLIIAIFSLVLSTLHSYFKQASVLARQRARVVFLGALLALPIPSIAVLIAALGTRPGGMTVLNNFSSIPITIFPATIAYAIARHNLFDVDVYIKRTVGYVMMTILVGTGYFVVQLMIESAILTPLFGEHAERIYPVVFAILIVFLFNPMNRLVQEKVDWLFFRKKYDYKETVTAVSNALTSVLDLDDILRRIIHTVRSEMFVDTAGVLLIGQQGKRCQSLFIGSQLDNQTSSSEETTRNANISGDDPLLSLLSRERHLITKYDVEEDARYANIRESCSARFSEIGASVMIPLVYQGAVTGALALGQKKSGHFYSREDIDLLSTLANHGAVAIENAKMAEQMKKEEIVRTNLSRYLSPQIVEHVINKDVKINLGGDKKVVTVLFSDIRNFTKITERYSPEQLVSILNEYFSEMAKIIFKNEGSLDKYIGDAIVAVFGSLIPMENSARSAVHAAIEMMKRMPILNESLMQKHGLTMDIGVGINTGEVFLGNIGSPERMEFTVIGDTVNVASRFSGLARPGQILITSETKDFLGPETQFIELPSVEVKGKTGKMKVCEIVYS